MSVIEGLDYGMTQGEAQLVLSQVSREQAAGLAETWRSITEWLARMGEPIPPKPGCIRAAEARAVPPPPPPLPEPPPE